MVFGAAAIADIIIAVTMIILVSLITWPSTTACMILTETKLLKKHSKSSHHETRQKVGRIIILTAETNMLSSKNSLAVASHSMSMVVSKSSLAIIASATMILFLAKVGGWPISQYTIPDVPLQVPYFTSPFVVYLFLVDTSLNVFTGPSFLERYIQTAFF